MRCQKLFEKGCIGGVEIRNRVAMMATQVVPIVS